MASPVNASRSEKLHKFYEEICRRWRPSSLLVNWRTALRIAQRTGLGGGTGGGRRPVLLPVIHTLRLIPLAFPRNPIAASSSATGAGGCSVSAEAWHVYGALGVAPPVGHRWLSCHQAQPMTITTARRRPDAGGGGGAPSCTLCTTSSAMLATRALGFASTTTSRAVVVTLAWLTARPPGRPARCPRRPASRPRRWRGPARG